MKQYTVYKVCRYLNTTNKLVSVCMNLLFPSPFCVTYQLDQQIKPNIDGTKLFVFDTYNHALSFAQILFKSTNRYRILKCTTSKIYKPKYISDIYYINKFWKLKQQHKKVELKYCSNKVPTGTLWCNELIPVEII